VIAYYGPEWETLASRIVGRWCPSFTGATGLQLPDTMGRNPGVLTNMDRNTSWVTSNGAGAINFDAANSTFVDLPLPAFDPANGVTISLWLYIVTYSTYFAITSNFQTWRISTAGITNLPGGQVPLNGLVVARQGAAFAGSTLPIALGTWYHVCHTWDRFKGLLYVNADPGTIVGTSGPNTGTVTRGYIGASGNTSAGPNSWGSANIDDVILCNTAVTANEVRFIYDQGRGGGMLLQPPRRRSYASLLAAYVLACEKSAYSLAGQSAGLFAGRSLPADVGQYLLTGQAANTLASRLLPADRAQYDFAGQSANTLVGRALKADQSAYTVTGNDAATLCARLLDGGAAAYALTGTDAGLIANRKLTADQAVCFLAGKNAELLRALKLSADSRSLQLDGFAASLLAGRKISSDGAQYILVVSDANLTSSTAGAAPYYYLFMMRGPQ